MARIHWTALAYTEIPETKTPVQKTIFAKVIGATHQAEEAYVNKAPGVCLLRAVLLEVRRRLEHESRGRNQQANNAEDIGTAVAFQAEQDGEVCST